MLSILDLTPCLKEQAIIQFSNCLDDRRKLGCISDLLFWTLYTVQYFLKFIIYLFYCQEVFDSWIFGSAHSLHSVLNLDCGIRLLRSETESLM